MLGKQCIKNVSPFFKDFASSKKYLINKSDTFRQSLQKKRLDFF